MEWNYFGNAWIFGYLTRDVAVGNWHLNFELILSSRKIEISQDMCIQPIADRMAQNLEIVSKHFQFGTRRTRILMGFIISTIHYVVLIVNPMGRFLVR